MDPNPLDQENDYQYRLVDAALCTREENQRDRLTATTENFLLALGLKQLEAFVGGPDCTPTPPSNHRHPEFAKPPCHRCARAALQYRLVDLPHPARDLLQTLVRRTL